MKENKNRIILTVLVCLLPAVAGILFWNQLPQNMPVHFNFAGEIDGYASKGFAAIGLPVILAVVHLITVDKVSFTFLKRSVHS